MNAAERVARARTFLGAPYLHQGRDANGIDCVGLLAYADEVDVDLIPAYPQDPVNGELETALTAHYGAPLLVGIPTFADLRVGDVVAMQYAGPTRHVALVGDYALAAGHMSLIHTDAMVGRVVEHRLDAKWLRRITRVYRP